MTPVRDVNAPRSLRECQFHLAVVWFAVTGALLVFMMLATFNDRFDAPAQVWDWILPTLIPTISIIVGGIVHGATSAGKDFEVDARIYRLAMGLSIAYLALVAIAAMLAGPYVVRHPGNIGVWLQNSKLWIASVEAPVGVALGVFFASSRPAASS